MKILQVNCVYRTGSTGKIVADIHTELLRNGYSSLVAYGRGQKEAAEGLHRTSNDFFGKLNHALSRVSGVLYGGCRFGTRRLIRLVKKERPDVVHLHCLNGFFVNIYALLKWIGKHNIKAVLTEHAEFMYTGSCGYALACDAWRQEGCVSCPQWRGETRSLLGDRTSKAFRKMKAAFAAVPTEKLQIVAVSPWLEQRSRQSLILKRFPHTVVFNGIDTAVFRRYEKAKADVYPDAEKRYAIFHATAFFSNDPNHIKGGYYLLKLAERMKDRPVQFYVAGSCEPGIEVPSNVTLLGRIEDQKTLAAYYSAADLTLLTSKRETFSMICAESLCCGTPLVGFYAGAPETVSMPAYSRFVDFGDVEALEGAVSEMLERAPAKEEIASAAEARYSKQRMVAEYCKVYEKVSSERRS